MAEIVLVAGSYEGQLEGGGGAVSALSFYGGTHLLSGGGDGDVCIWRTSDWECLLRMKGHSAPIEALAVHPSGRLALSVCAGRKLRLWNLQTGKCNYTSALPQPTRVLLWTPRGDAYVTAAGSALRLHALGGEAAEMLHEQPVHSSAAAAHASRIKCLVSTFRSCGGGGAHLSSASTDGSIRLWRLVAAGASEPARLESLLLLRTSLRLTALCASLSRAGVGGERPRQTKALAGAEKPRKKAKERRGDPSGAAAAGAKKRKKKRPDPAEYEKSNALVGFGYAVEGKASRCKLFKGPILSTLPVGGARCYKKASKTELGPHKKRL
ncbi:hypothetical protein EMIHUDRAFT_215132 [Emiliania huxleyi CCMP1516]|uniref:Uncharacterized protein n=2 Tax=Emiliania huxleyi TaxID=2903 RepID=A0A0D3IHZ2_EMIH1|nr:hypothetical protein EMIHUDRAFT_215132 [Emiliania huxleyi CCMP1516]EOD10877.1 hypothetical protein EMIHUDRAFT_215132 [Emiliania huxleyi CCMP1516]|eukprot:XP_005763306.1 hypothetical protein EMIHUDRAFT_215132 [Emiliania huxleyi CCMP1516]